MELEDQIRENLEKARRNLNEVLRIALIGQPGAGKSSLINRIMGKKIFETGVHTDTTVEAQEARLDKMFIVDLPGYGTNRFPFDDWVKKFQPQNYDLYLFVFNGKLHDSDIQMFQALKEWSNEDARGRIHPLFVVRNFCETLWDEVKKEEELRADVVRDVRDKMQDDSRKVYFTSCGRHPEGIEELKEAIKKADIPGAKKSKFLHNFRATTLKDLEEKKDAMLDSICWYATTGAANALNPIPGVDVSVDIGIMYKLFSDIRATFGINDETESELKKYQIILPVGNKVFAYATKEGIQMLLKNVAGKYAEKEFSKYIPFVGQAIAATAGFALIRQAGISYLDDCYEIAQKLMEKMIENERK